MLKVTERVSNAELETHRPGYAVFDVGSYSIFVHDRLVDWLVVLLVLFALALSLVVLASGLDYAARSLLGRLDLAVAAPFAPRLACWT